MLADSKSVRDHTPWTVILGHPAIERVVEIRHDLVEDSKIVAPLDSRPASRAGPSPVASAGSGVPGSIATGGTNGQEGWHDPGVFDKVVSHLRFEATRSWDAES